VLFDGVHTLARSGEVLRAVLQALFVACEAQKVDLTALILKTSMALPGKDAGIPLVSEDIARETVSALLETVPHQVAGIVFLSGGQTSQQATENLNAIGMMGVQPSPITFSYSRAIEEPVLEVWRGVPEQVSQAQQILIEQLQNNCRARIGQYDA
jgi:fructose-bisphosphate aldolase class I